MKVASVLLGFAALAASLTPSALAAPKQGGVRVPARDSAERRAILDALRPKVVRDLGAPIEFVVGTLRVSGDDAFVTVTPQRPGGKAIVPRNTPIGRQIMRDEGSLDLFDCCHTEALLKRTRGVWRVSQIGIGATDVWWEDLCRKLPKGLCTMPSSTRSE